MRRGAFRTAVVLVVLGLGIVAGVSVAAADDGNTTAATNERVVTTLANGSDGAVGTTPAQSSTLTVTQEYRLTPDQPGRVDIQWQFTIPDNVVEVKTQFPADAVNPRRNGFEKTDSGSVWKESEQSTRTPTLTYTAEVNRTADVSGPIGSDGRFMFVDKGDWALLQRRPGPDLSFRFRQPEPTVERINTTAGEGVAGQSLVFLGSHETYERQAHDQRFRLVVPDAADLQPDRSDVFQTVMDTSGTLRVGDRDRQVLMFVAPATVPWAVRGLQTGDRDFYGVADEPVDTANNVWIHEYVHTRQDYETTDTTRWTKEAFAEYYAGLLTLEQGRIDFEAFRQYLDRGTRSRYGDVVLADNDTWDGTGGNYYVGALATGEIDRRIRLATGRESTLQAVFGRMNSQSTLVRQSDLLGYIGSVAGSTPQSAARQYTETTTRPEVWSQIAHSEAFQRLPAQFAYAFPTAGSNGLRVSGPYRNRTLASEVLVPGETLTADVNVTNIGGSEGEYELTVARDGETIATRTGTALAGESVTERVRATFDTPGTFTLSTGEDELAVEVVEPATPTVTDLAVNRTQIAGSGTVRVTATVENSANRPGNGTVTIRRGGETLASRHVRLDAGGSTEVSATATLTDPGEYEFGAGGQSVTVTVGEATSGETGDGEGTAGESGPGFGVAVTVLALAGLLLVAHRRK